MQATLTAPFRNTTTKIKIDVVKGICTVPARRMRDAEKRLKLGANEPIRTDTSFVVVNAAGHMIQALDER